MAGFLAEGDHIASHAVFIVAHAAAFAGELALAVDDARAEQLGDDVDDAGAADADRRFAADDGVARLHRLGVDRAGIDRAVGGAHAAGDVAALERRARRAGAAHQEFVVAEHQLAVRAQVDEQRQLLAVPDHRGERAGGDVAADVAADVRRKDQLCLRVQAEAQLVGAEVVGQEEAGDVRLHAHRIGEQAQQQVVHGGVAGQAHAVDAAAVDRRRGAHLREQRAEGFVDHGLRQPLGAALAAGLDDAVDDIGAVADLAVASGRLGENRAGLHVHQRGGDRRGAQVDHEPGDRCGVLRRQHVEHGGGFTGDVDHAARAEAVLAQHARQILQRGIAEDGLLDAQQLTQLAREALVVGHGVVGRRLAQLDGERGQAVAEFDARGLNLLLRAVEDGQLLFRGDVRHAHVAAVGRGDVRPLDAHVGDHLAHAREPPALGVFGIGDVARPGRIQLSGNQPHPALAAGAIARAGRVDGHVGAARDFEQVVALRSVDHHVRTVGMKRH